MRCVECGEAVQEDPDGSPGVLVHDRDLKNAHDLDEDHVPFLDEDECNTCGGTGRWQSTLEDAPTTLVDLGPCPDCEETKSQCPECEAFEVVVEGELPVCQSCDWTGWPEEELPNCEKCGQPVEPDWVEKHECYSQWTGPLVGQNVKVSGYGGVAFWVAHHHEANEKVIAIMVGDDREWEFSVSEIEILPREDFCGECGQIGCTHDGLER